MNITVVYGTEHKGCTYQIAQEVIRSFEGAQVTELFLPRELPEYCISCFRCFTEKPGTCSHSQYTDPLREKLLQADLIILTSPVYSFHVTGQMKTFLDHFANMWMVHRPEQNMFSKLGIVISTACGPVFKKTLQEMKDSLDFWGVAKTYQIGCAMFQTDWKNVSESTKAKLLRKVRKTTDKIKTRQDKKKVKPCFRVKKWFYMSRIMQKHFKTNPADVTYWEEMGWTGNVRPWRKTKKRAEASKQHKESL